MNLLVLVVMWFQLIYPSLMLFGKPSDGAGRQFTKDELELLEEIEVLDS